MFGTRFTLFSVGGIPIRVDVSWFVIAILLTWSLAVGWFPAESQGLASGTYWAMGVIGALALFACIILHELGHALTAERRGVPMRGITLFIFGGVAEMDHEPKSARDELWVAIAGPIVSVILAAGFYGLYALGGAAGWPYAVTGVLRYLWIINAVVVLFNMIPAFPLDGGRVLRAILWGSMNSLRRATRITANIGAGFGALLIGAGVLFILMGSFVGGLWWALIGLFLRAAAKGSYQQLLVRRALEGEPVRRFMRPEVVTVPADTPVDAVVEDYVYRYHHKMLPVVGPGDDQLRGCVTTRAIKEIPRETWSQRRASEVMESCTSDNTVGGDADAMDALSKMNRTGQSRLMVAEGGRLLGVIALKDLLRFLSLKVELEEGAGYGADIEPLALPAARHPERVSRPEPRPA